MNNKTIRKTILRIWLFLFPTKRIRRLVVISSLIPRFNKGKEIDEKTLKEINQALSLCNNYEAMKLPASLSDEFFKDVDIDNNLNDIDSIRQTSESIYAKLPDWLRYDGLGLEKDLTILQSIIDGR